MVIGLTYDAKADYIAEGFSSADAAEFDEPETIDAIAGALQYQGFEVCRIGKLKDLVKDLAADKRVDLVFNIAEGISGPLRESEIPLLLEAYSIPHTFSRAWQLARCMNKELCQSYLQSKGIAVPDFFCVHDIADLEKLELRLPVFAKPAREGSSKGIDANACVKNKQDLRAVVSNLLQTFSQPVMLEEYLPGAELTVGILGNGDRSRSIGAMEIEWRAHCEVPYYTLLHKQHWSDFVQMKMRTGSIAAECEKVALQAYRVLELCDAARIDLRLDNQGRPKVIDVNPLPGLHPRDSDLVMLARFAGIEYRELISEIVTGAIERNRLVLATG